MGFHERRFGWLLCAEVDADVEAPTGDGGPTQTLLNVGGGAAFPGLVESETVGLACFLIERAGELGLDSVVDVLALVDLRRP